jgi:hypothetical protein
VSESIGGGKSRTYLIFLQLGVLGQPVKGYSAPKIFFGITLN